MTHRSKLVKCTSCDTWVYGPYARDGLCLACQCLANRAEELQQQSTNNWALSGAIVGDGLEAVE